MLFGRGGLLRARGLDEKFAHRPGQLSAQPPARNAAAKIFYLNLLTRRNFGVNCAPL
jgi:hypothetical protein